MKRSDVIFRVTWTVGTVWFAVQGEWVLAAVWGFLLATGLAADLYIYLGNRRLAKARDEFAALHADRIDHEWRDMNR